MSTSTFEHRRDKTNKVTCAPGDRPRCRDGGTKRDFLDVIVQSIVSFKSLDEDLLSQN